MNPRYIKEAKIQEILKTASAHLFLAVVVTVSPPKKRKIEG